MVKCRPAQLDGSQLDTTSPAERAPTRVKAWAPKDRTPCIQFHFNWKHVWAIAGPMNTNSV
jgi:hypothetical protein